MNPALMKKLWCVMYSLDVCLLMHIVSMGKGKDALFMGIQCLWVYSIYGWCVRVHGSIEVLFTT